MADSDSESRLDSLSKSSSDFLDDGISEEENEGISSSTFSRERIQVLHAITIGATEYYRNYLHKTPCHNREYSGWASLMSILNGHDRRCQDNFRMKPHVFFELCGLLVNNYGLKSMRTVTVEEQLATFMMTVGVREGNRQLQESFQRSGYTISKSFHNVLRACTQMSLDWVKPFNDHTITPSYIKDNPRYFPHFKDCIGAIDGTHIKASLPCHLQVPYIGRKGHPTQNIMVACDFDMCFTFVLPGWEGSAHDTRIFYSAIRDASKKFPMPPKGKYYLVDSGYPNISGFLAPYKGQKYYIPEFQRASWYNNHYETFNHLHSSLRGTIERCFGVWKSKFQMISDVPVNIAWPDQVALVSATMAIHNFIRKTDSEDGHFLNWNHNSENYEDEMDGDSRGSTESELQQSDETMNKVRDDICASIAFGRMGIPLR